MGVGLRITNGLGREMKTLMQKISGKTEKKETTENI